MNNKIIIFDTTLRDGEQSPGASMNIDEKIKIALQLEKLGVDVIEAGFAASSTGDFCSISEISKSVKDVTVCTLSRCVESDILKSKEAIENAKKGRIHLFIATSPIHMEYKLKKKPEEVMKTAIECIKFARSYCDDIQFSCEDACRSDIGFLKEISLACIEAGAKTLNMPDTVGYRLPFEVGEIIKSLHEAVGEKAILSVHCHNDLGQAVSNSIYGILNGARQVECTINGLGERAGNSALEEVVMILKTRKDIFQKFNFELGINTKELYPTSRLVSDITGINPQPNKAIVGKNAFSHESGIHQDGILKHRETYEIMKPSDIGIKDHDNLVLGKHSGRAAFKDRIAQMGFDLSDADMQIAFEKFKKICDLKKVVFEDDIRAILFDQVAPNDIFILDSIQISTASDGVNMAAVKISKDGIIMMDSALGNGAIDSIMKAIERVTNVKSTLLDYKVMSVSAGKDAVAKVSVKIDFEKLNHPIIGHGSDLDTIKASAKAYINALNSYMKMKDMLKDKENLRFA